MVWGSASIRGMGNIVFLKSTVAVDLTIRHTVYMEVLESHLVSSIENLYGICVAMKI